MAGHMRLSSGSELSSERICQSFVFVSVSHDLRFQLAQMLKSSDLLDWSRCCSRSSFKDELLGQVGRCLSTSSRTLSRITQAHFAAELFKT